MLSRALTRALPSAGLLTKQAFPRTIQTTLLRHSATQAIRLPVMPYQPLPYLDQPATISPTETAAATMATGKLVPDEIVTAMLESYLRTNAKDGWVLDGFPRNARQAEMLLSHVDTIPDMVIEIVVSHDDIRERLFNRRIDPVTGGVYNLTGDLPIDDEIISRLEKRADDCEQVIERRLRVYEESMPGVTSVFRAHDIPVVQVISQGGASVKEVGEKICEVAHGKRIVLAGAPGCGKGTQGVLLAERFGGEHVSTGDLLRKATRLASEGICGGIVDQEMSCGVMARL